MGFVSEGIWPTDKNTPITGSVKVREGEGKLRYRVTAWPKHGTLDFHENGQWTYVPKQDYVGEDQFTVAAENESGFTATTIIRLYMAPLAEDIIEALNRSHPRLLAKEEDFVRIRSLVHSDARAKRWFQKVKEEADGFLREPPKAYSKPDGLRLDTTSAKRAVTLSFMYQVTQEAVYAKRAWEEIAHAASAAYPDWSPEHYLDTAMMTHGIAIAYDWLYSYLSEDQRAVVREAIAKKGLSPAVPMYLKKSHWWVYNRDNWNFVCNAGMALGAMAIADEEEELAGLILKEAFKSVQYALTQYAPDGSAIEGPAYWEYGTMYLIYLLNALETSFGHDFGFSNREGLAETACFPIYIAGPGGTFNYSDNRKDLIPGRLLLWFANKFGKPEYTWYHQYADERAGVVGVYDLIWYRPEIYGAYEPSHLDQYFDRPKAVTMRESWSDDALFVGLKGGVNGAPHGDLDAGTFVFDALGVRWAEDLGREDYNLPGYWEMEQTGGRWQYYRKRTEGHNTLVIQPSQESGQWVGTVSEIVKTSFHQAHGAYAIADLTPAYREEAVKVRRGARLMANRRQFLLQDEVELKAPSELYWWMHTRAEIDIREDGAGAMLTCNNQRLWVQILSPQRAVFSVLDAAPLPSSPNPPGQTSNAGVKKLAIHLKEVSEETIAVWMVPLQPGEAMPGTAPEAVPLARWEELM